jgi:hypothetical protein
MAGEENHPLKTEVQKREFLTTGMFGILPRPATALTNTTISFRLITGIRMDLYLLNTESLTS